MGDLMNIPYSGDAKIEASLTLWKNQVEGQREPLSDGNLEILLYEKTKKSELLSTQIGNYERHPQSHPNKSYNNLVSVIKTAVGLQRKDKNGSAMVCMIGMRLLFTICWSSHMCPTRPPFSAATMGENEEESESKRNGMKFSMPQRSHVQVDDVCRQNRGHLGLQETGRGPSRGHE